MSFLLIIKYRAKDMNTMCRNIIEKSVIGVLIYAGKRFVDKCFFDKKNREKRERSDAN